MAETESGARAGFGLFGSIRSALGHLVELAHTRLELLSVEMEARLLNSRQVMLWSLIAVLSAFLALLMFTFTVLIIFWDDHRLLAASLLTLLFAGLALGAALTVRRRVRSRPRLLAATISELKRDAAALGKEH